MNIKVRLSILNFFEFFVWGSWLISAGVYMSSKLLFTGVQIGAVYATMGITSLFMPTIIGVIADRWIPAEKLFGYCHWLIVGLLLLLTQVESFSYFYTIMFLVNCFYMPSISLNYSVSYSVLSKLNLDIIKNFPSIRVWGTIGFIVAAWSIDLMDWSTSEYQFFLSAGASAFLGIYAFTFPKSSVSKPENKIESKSFLQRFGNEALMIFKNKRLLIFFIFSIFMGSVLQITNIWGVPFLNDFALNYPESFAVRHSVFLLSLSQISETIFILAIPFFYKKFGIKIVILISMIAWVFRFGFFGIGNPEGMGLGFLIASMIIYGMAFDFFNISGSLYVEEETPENMRSSAQGLFAMTTGGLGPILGAYGSGYIVDFFTNNSLKDWPTIWFVFTGYALVIALCFAMFFKYIHKRKENLE
jgi:NHS family xanthosine MFS transporter